MEEKGRLTGQVLVVVGVGCNEVESRLCYLSSRTDAVQRDASVVVVIVLVIWGVGFC